MKNYLGNNADELGEVPENETEYEEAILRVLDNPGKYKNMRESVVKYYSLEAVSARMEKVFKSL